jgi:hypothetical protein
MPRFVVSDGRGGEVAIICAPDYRAARACADQFAAAEGIPPDRWCVHPARIIRRDMPSTALMGAA